MWPVPGAADVGSCAWGEVTPAASLSPRFVHIISENPGFSCSLEARVNKEPSIKFPEISCQNPPLDHIRSLLPPKESLRRPFPFSGDSSRPKTPLEAPGAPFPGLSAQSTSWIPQPDPAQGHSGSLPLSVQEPKRSLYHQHSAAQPPRLRVAVPRGIQRIPSHWQAPCHFAAHTGTGLPLPNLFHLGALYWGVGGMLKWGERPALPPPWDGRTRGAAFHRNGEGAQQRNAETPRDQ